MRRSLTPIVALHEAGVPARGKAPHAVLSTCITIVVMQMPGQQPGSTRTNPAAHVPTRRHMAATLPGLIVNSQPGSIESGRVTTLRRWSSPGICIGMSSMQVASTACSFSFVN
jgi:hypothetical protein